MKKTLRSFLMTALFLSVAQTGTAKDKAPAAPVQAGVASRSLWCRFRVMTRCWMTLASLGVSAQREGLEKQADAMITLFTQAKGLNGLDTKRPLGIVLGTDGTGLEPIGFLPVTDLKKLLNATAGLIGPIERRPDGVLQIERLNQNLCLKENKRLALRRANGREPGQPTDRSDAMAGRIGQAVSSRRKALRSQHSGHVPLA